MLRNLLKRNLSEKTHGPTAANKLPTFGCRYIPFLRAFTRGVAPTCAPGYHCRQEEPSLRSHAEIDQRSLSLARAIVTVVDQDPAHAGLERARASCERWLEIAGMTPAMREWQIVLRGTWENVRQVLLDTSECGVQLRQSSPFVGIVDKRARRAIWKEYRNHNA